MKNKKGFTLIELIAVVVIMAILALIVTPLLMNIIKKAKIASAKRSIDGYGRSIELAITGYLMDNGAFPTSIEDLTIEYSGPEVVCETTQLNPDSSVYLEGCTVNGKSIDYEYGTDKAPTYDAYEIGDEVTYNNVDYYVIENSGAKASTVKLLKKTPLTVAEVNLYGGVGTANNHVNMYETNNTSAAYYQTADNCNGYGGMAYYTSPTCGYSTGEWIESGCKMDYADSEIKYVVDAWKTAEAPQATSARLISIEEIRNNYTLEEYKPCGDGCGVIKEKITSDTPWMFDSDYTYWTMSINTTRSNSVWTVGPIGQVNFSIVHNGNYYHDRVVRPLIVLSKSVL